jgi:hypothetical protein
VFAKPLPLGDDLAGQRTSQAAGASFRQLQRTKLRVPLVAAERLR